ncbi:hypothetical protein ACOSP7_031997 [Xanthoceras sorbifolium]|uniref:Protein LNK3 n=1 Tax=Xanthoceras sorbifolium TaxID=99658 RepID=A0ABQ8H561_9ROSI|nr:hypothetical protein JRO89_XS14G0134700 [Xanthoceras sorbifolium]
MDWHFGNGVDDLVVPRDQELSDGFPSSPEFWSKWGTCDSENFVSQSKCFDMDDMMEEEFKFNGLCSEDMETGVQDKDQCSGSVVCGGSGGSSEDSLQRTAVSCNHQDYPLDHFAGIEQLDDIFLDSLLEDLPRNEDVHKSFSFTSESQCFLLPANSLSTDMTINSQSNSSDEHSKGSSKYLKTHAFSPSLGWEKGEVADSSFIPCNSEQRDFVPVKAPLVEVRVASEKNGANGPEGEKPSVEESVLQDLKIVMAQLTDETRICFRDAFYRLASNSKHHVTPLCQKGDFSTEASPGTDHDISKRSGKRKPMESETNIFDRAIANLVYDKMDLNVREFPTTAAMYPRQEGIGTTGSPNQSSNKLEVHHDRLTGDAEVPRFGEKHPEIAAKPEKEFSKGLVESSV